jgi:rare lipoprotein A
MLRSILLVASTFLSIAFLPVPALAKQCGQASFYGPGFHGRTTANGERFNSQAMTAAHRSLPFGSRIKVTNQANGRSVVIRVNDDGPHYGSRIIDLSEAAFSKIASLGQGVARVCVSQI